MREKVYNEYLRVIKIGLEDTNDNSIHFNYDLINQDDQQDIVVTVKNYNT